MATIVNDKNFCRLLYIYAVFCLHAAKNGIKMNVHIGFSQQTSRYSYCTIKRTIRNTKAVNKSFAYPSFLIGNGNYRSHGVYLLFRQFSKNYNMILCRLQSFYIYKTALQPFRKVCATGHTFSSFKS